MINNPFSSNETKKKVDFLTRVEWIKQGTARKICQRWKPPRRPCHRPNLAWMNAKATGCYRAFHSLTYIILPAAQILSLLKLLIETSHLLQLLASEALSFFFLTFSVLVLRICSQYSHWCWIRAPITRKQPSQWRKGKGEGTNHFLRNKCCLRSIAVSKKPLDHYLPCS